METHLAVAVVVLGPLSRQELSVSSSTGKVCDEDSRSFDSWGFHGWSSGLLQLFAEIRTEKRRQLQTPKKTIPELRRQMRTTVTGS
jgi:hypothetical protein